MGSIKSFAVLGAFVALSAAPVQAQLEAETPTGWDDGNVWEQFLQWQGTGGSNFATSMSVDLRYKAGDGISFIGMVVENMGSVGEVFTRIGLVNLGGTVVSNGSTSGDNQLDDWGANSDDALGGDGLPEGTWAWIAPPPRVKNGLENGDAAFFMFAMSGAVDLNRIGAAVHAQSGPNGCSTKLGVWRDAAGNLVTNDKGPDYSPECGGTTTVPEPGTLALLATSFMGFAWVSRRRRGELELTRA